MPLTKDRHTPYRDGFLAAFPMKKGVTIHAGAIVVAGADGYARPGRKAAGDACLGRAEEAAALGAGASSGDAAVLVRRGFEFLWGNAAGGDSVTAAHVGRPCFIEDDETVAATDGGDARSLAGTVAGVSGDGVWVRVGMTPSAAGETGLRRVLHGEIEADASNIAANAARDLTINDVNGAAVGDPVAVAPPAAIDDGLAVVGFVSAADTVKVRLINTTSAAINPPNATYRVAVIKS